MLELLKYDLRLQWRHGFWLVYFVVTIIYLLVLFSLPLIARPLTALGIVLMDTSVLGVIFVGAMVLLEKQQNVMQSLFVTPLKLNIYLLSKTVSLTLLATVMSMVVYIPAAGFDRGTVLLILIVLLASALFILIGISVSARVTTLNQYLGRLILLSVGIMIPLAPFILLDNATWLRVFPSNALYEIALLIESDTFNLIAITDLLILIFWLLISWYWAISQFKKHILNR